MANIVIASNDPMCQATKNWFLTQMHYVAGPPLDKLSDGDTLIIIAHDTELGNASGFLKQISAFDFPMAAKFDIKLIVCSAASLTFGSNLETPAETVANHFQRTVWAAKGLVTGNLTQLSAVFKGDYIKVEPNTDLTSKFGQLNIHK